MPDKIEVYDLKGKLLCTEDRAKFYSEIKKEFTSKGKISKQIKTIRLILMNSKGRIYLQKRSNIKTENSGLYDKTVGGHVRAGDSYDLTAMRECAEELGFPASILDQKEFLSAVKTTDLSIVGIFKKVDQLSNFQTTRTIGGGHKIIQPFMTSLYIGYYDGAIRFVDGEISGIEVFSFDELKKEIKKSTEKFTEDLKFIIKKYGKFLVPVSKL